jgi:hypothetical protein
MILPMFLVLTAATSGMTPACWIRGEASRLAERPSPLDSVIYALGADTLKVCYGRPSVRGREIMGGVVPFQSPWRLGANEATTLYVPFGGRVAGVALEPGRYSLYVVPTAEQWTIVVNREPARWGLPISPVVQERDVGRGTVPVERLEQPVEMLTMRFEPRGNAADLIIEWERTRVRVPIEHRGS